MEKRDLRRACTACGIQKPISAFLQITADQGTTYGAICASCRGKGIREKVIKKPILEEDRGSTTSESRVGIKQRAEVEKAKAKQLKETKEKDLAEKRRRENFIFEKFERGEEIKKSEKDIRNEISIKQNVTIGKPTKPFGTQSIIGQRMEERAAFAASAQFNEKQQTIEVNKTQEAIKQELQTNRIDPNATPHHDQAKTRSVGFNAYLAWLGPSAPVVRAVMGRVLDNKAAAKSQVDTAKNNLQKTASKLSTQPTTFAKLGPDATKAKINKENSQTQNTESVNNYIKKRWGSRGS